MATSSSFGDLDEDEPRIRDLLFRPLFLTGTDFNPFVYNYHLTRLREKQLQIQRLIQELEEDLKIINDQRRMYEEQEKQKDDGTENKDNKKRIQITEIGSGHTDL